MKLDVRRMMTRRDLSVIALGLALSALFTECERQPHMRLEVYWLDWDTRTEVRLQPGSLIGWTPATLPNGITVSDHFTIDSNDTIAFVLNRLRGAIPAEISMLSTPPDVRIDVVHVTADLDTLSFSNTGVMYWRARWYRIDWSVLSVFVDRMPWRNAERIRSVGRWKTAGMKLR